MLGHSDIIAGITLGANRIHTVSNDKTLRIWDKATGECVRVLKGFGYIPIHAADERFIYLTAWADLIVFDAETGEKIAEMRLATDKDLQAIAMDESRVFISARDGKLFVIDKDRLAVDQTLDKDGSSWALACGRGRLYLSHVDGSVAVWDRATLRPLGLLTGHRGNIQRLAVDDRYLYSLSADRALIVWSQEDGTSVERLSKVFARSMIGMVSDETYLYLANVSEGLKILEKESWEFVATRPDLRVPYGKGMAVDTRCLYLGLADFSIAILDKEGVIR